MALRLVNATPGEVVEPLVPGQPVVFSLKSENAHVRFPSLRARLTYSNIVHKSANGVALLPEANETLLKNARVVLETPERRRPVASIMPRQASGTSFLIGPGSGGIDAGVYEVDVDVPTYGGVLASVTFRLNPTWVPASRYWCNFNNLLPLYLGFEYGIRNTGLFLALRDDSGTGTLVAGGPLHAFNAARPLQAEYVINWDSWLAGASATIFFEVDSDLQTISVWLQAPNEPAPILVDTFALGQLTEFDPSSSTFAQKRDGASQTVRLFFGNGGGTSDVVEILDYAIYPRASWGVQAGNVLHGHVLKVRPDLPGTFKATEKKLPDACAIGRWLAGGNLPPVTSFWYQPGRRTVPLYAKFEKPANMGYANSFLYRTEPCLTLRESGFAVEAWMAGRVSDMGSHDTGLGIRVHDGQNAYTLTALDTQGIRSWGILKDPLSATDWARGFVTPVDGEGNLRYAEHHALRLVRFVGDRFNNRLQVFVDDMDSPLLSTPMSDISIPSGEVEGRIEIGHLPLLTTSGEVQLAAVSYMNRYVAWERHDDPNNLFALAQSDVGAAEVRDGRALVQKLSYGTGADKFLFYRRNDNLTFLRGCQVDFRTKVISYTDVSGVSDAANTWTGGGVTLFFGSEESPVGENHKLHVGFFDCGAFGRKIAVLPGVDGVDHILNQTALGKLYSADAQWTELASYRLVYKPYDRIEVYGPGLITDEPIISIPWSKYVPQQDFSGELPGVAFGAFASDSNCLTEWEFFRWGVSSGYEVELLQPPGELGTVFDGRGTLYVEADELLTEGV